MDLRTWNLVDLRAGSESEETSSVSDLNGGETLILLYGDVQGNKEEFGKEEIESRAQEVFGDVKIQSRTRVQKRRE